MKRSRALRAEREAFGAQLQDGRDARQLEVAFHAAHPQYSQEEGQRLAAQFVAATLVLATHVEAGYRGEERPTGPMPDHAPYWEIKAYLNAEQKATLEAAWARVEQLEMKQKAESYDELLETLAKCGLAPDSMRGEDGKWKEIVTVENLKTATEWWNEAHGEAYEDGEDD